MICSICKQDKPKHRFYIRKSSGNRRKDCIDCNSKRCAKYRKNNKQKIKEMKSLWQKNNKDKKAVIAKRYYQNNKEKVNEYVKRWKRTKRSINAKLIDNYRSRINKAVTRKSNSTKKLLGCDIDFLIKYLENKFKKGMTWDNYGEWHIDHIIPCASFNLTNQEELTKCFNYCNLQPLWAEENRAKSDKITVK